MAKFKFSVIMAIYNVEKYLEEAIESVINQTIGFKEIQLLLVNDGSPDNSEKICKKYQKKYPDNIVYIKKENGGVSSARNAGLKKATGEIINFLDSDDYFSPNAFEKVYNFFKKEKTTDVVAINLINFENSSGSWVNGEFFQQDNLIDMNNEYNFMQCQVGASFIRAEKAKLFIFDTNIKIHEDSHYLYRIFQLNPRCGTISEATYFHRIRANGNSATQTIKHKKNIFEINQKVFLSLIKHYLEYNEKIPRFLQTFILIEFNYYVIQKISICKFNSEEKQELLNDIKSIMSYITEEAIVEHRYISEEDKDTLLKIKYSDNCAFLFKKHTKIKNYCKKIKRHTKSAATWLPRKVKRKVLYSVERNINNLFYLHNEKEQEIKLLKEENIMLRNLIDEIQKQINTMQKQINTMQKQINTTEEKTNDKINFLDNDLKTLTTTQNDTTTILNDLGGRHNLDIMLLKNKINEIGNNVAYTQYIDYISTHEKDKKFNPLVSVIIPVYNGSNYIKRAVQSVLNQTYENIEIIIVDDGSDDSDELQKNISEFGKHIKYYRKNNDGVSSALNFGIKKMKGEYFAWLSHDDEYLPNHIMEHINRISYEKDKKIVTYSFFEIIDENNEILLNENIASKFSNNNYCTNQNHKLSYLNGDINGCNIIIPKEAFEKVGYFNEKLKYSQEKEMWNRLAQDYKIIQIPLITAYLRVHKASVTSSIKDNQETIDTIIQIINSLTEEEIKEIFINKENAYNQIAYNFGTSRYCFDIEKGIKGEYNEKEDN